jgi:RNA polymerase sigma-70 factor (ECF subfamily)
MGELRDVELVAKLADGNLAALRELYDRHASWLSMRLARRCADRDVVADALQDCFTAAWRQADEWRGEGEVAAWLWGIAVRRLVSRLRSPTARPAVSPQPWPVEAEPSAEERVLLSVEYGDLGQALQRLSPELRAVVQATILDGLTSKEAARLLGIPQNTVKTRLHRAKAHLRTELTGGLT